MEIKRNIHFILSISLILLANQSFSQKTVKDFGFAKYEVIYKHYREAPDGNNIVVREDKTILDYDKLLNNYTSFLYFNNVFSKYETTSTGSPRDFIGNALTNLYDTYYNCLPKKEQLVERVHKGYIEYISDDRPLVWEISQDTILINGLQCIKAIGKKQSPGWNADIFIAWFTPDIPAPFGPNDMNGLPGLILKYKWAYSVVEAVNIKELTDQKYKLELPNSKDVISYNVKALEAKKKRAEILKNKTTRKN
ncbi:MAG TPA: GLPGLI family protein [Saprospiraceae bacterium]|nr:GLPGLI family protein [Saprospiraceae bacterium]